MSINLIKIIWNAKKQENMTHKEKKTLINGNKLRNYTDNKIYRQDH